jgi:alpha-L-rhamnosidase
MRPTLKLLGLLLCSIGVSVPLLAQTSMEQTFPHPPDSAKPRVWWHWLSGNVTEKGITADLEWMHRVNIGGFQMFERDERTDS